MVERQKKRTRLKPEVRRAQLLDVGLEVFAKKGMAATNLDEVALAAGVTKRVVYHYFENKQAFFDAIAEREMRIIATRMRDAAVTANVAEDIAKMSQSLFAYLAERPHGFGALLSHAPIAWQGQDRLSELRTAFYSALAYGVREELGGSDAEVDGTFIGHAMVGTFIFAAQHWLSNSSRPSADEAAKELSDLVLRGFVGLANVRRPTK
ncbi:MAG: TetR/AcrR family transcriptional regulator [Myxococcota bacterium]